MSRKIEDLLQLAADTQTFYPHKDALTACVERCGGDELSMDELDFVAAAASVPSYQAFLDTHLRKGNQTGGN